MKKLLGPSVRVPPSLQADKDFTMATFSPCRGFALLLLLSLQFLTASAHNLVIDTEGGKVRGKLIPSLGHHIRAFLGIPYGKPPVGELRFNPPQPAESWEGVLDATQYSDSCYQIPDDTFPGFFGSEMWKPNTPLSEDCLHLNVWAPRFKKDAPLAHVLVWVYGGAFTSGTASLPLYDGRYLSETEDVIIVSMNYRVGVLGFLTTPADEGLPGNAGLMDQRLALQWVANNIAAFGGDPTKVTLFGESAGSASVGFQLISPGSQSFFTRAVMQSGVPSAPWAVLSQEETWRRSTKLAELLGCPLSPPADMKVCLQQADPQDLLNNQYNTLIVPEIVPIPFAPYVDGHFLPDTVEALISAGKLPKKDVMFGINQNEGTYFLIYTVAGFSNIGDSIITRDEFLSGVPITMSYSSDVVREMATFQYTDWTDENDGMKNRDALGAMVGDQMIACPALEFARRYSLHGGKTFVYSFDHRSTINVWPEWMGVMHGYEIEFVFGMPLNASLGYTEKEVDMSKKFMKHWANFARSGNPGIDGDWPTFTDEKQEYVTLNTNAPEAKMRLKAKECQLWNTFLPKIQKASDALDTCVAAKQ